jgi:RNA polymerase sigma-70 factor (ECF subfamily)
LEAIRDDWIRDLRRGSTGAFERIMDATNGMVYGTALRITGNREEAEDVLQDAFLRLWKNRSSVQNAGAWLRRVAMNLALDVLRRRKKRRTLEEFPAAPERGRGPSADRLHRELDGMEPERRETYILRVFGGLSYREIAEKTGASLGTVMSRLHRARNELYEGLKDEL